MNLDQLNIEEKFKKYSLVNDTDPILRRKPKPFDFNGDMDPKELVAILTANLLKHRGMGISANQIGLDYSVFIIGIAGVFIEVFNPTIVNYTGKEILGAEGCLSFPGMYVSVKRPGAIHVKFQTVTGEYKEELYNGLTARIFLHEYDHMQGILFKDKVSKMKWDMALKRKIKTAKKHNTKIY